MQSRHVRSLRSKRSLALRTSNWDVVASDDVDQDFNVSVWQILSGHFLPLFSLRLQRPPGFSQLEQVYSQNSEKKEKTKTNQNGTSGICQRSNFNIQLWCNSDSSGLHSAHWEDHFYRSTIIGRGGLANLIIGYIILVNYRSVYCLYLY